MDHIAIDTTAAVIEKFHRAGHFFHDIDGHDGRDDQLRVRMFERRAGRSADVLEDHAVHQARIFFQIDKPIAIDPEISRMFSSERLAMLTS